MSTLRQSFGNRLKEIREARNMTQEELALEANLHRTTAGKIERAKTGASLDTIQRLAEVLNIHPKDFFTTFQPDEDVDPLELVREQGT